MTPTLDDLTAAQAAAEQAQARLEALALRVVADYVLSLAPDVAYLRLEPRRGGRLVLGDSLDARMRPVPRDDDLDLPGFTAAMSALAHVDDDGWWVDELTVSSTDGFSLLLDLAAVTTRAPR